MIVGILVTAAACVLAAYFSALHTVLKTFSRKRLGDLLEEKNREKDLAFVVDHLSSLMLLTGLIRSCCGMVVVLATLYLLQTRPGPEPYFPSQPYLITFLISSVLLGVFSVAIPGSWARYSAERLLAWSVPVLRLLSVVFAPAIRALSLFDPVVRRLSGVDLQETEDDMAEQVLATVEDHDEADTVADDQKQMIEAVFDLRDTDADEIMTPRTEIQGIEVTATLEQVKQAILEFGHSRVPVYGDNLDEIHGILYAKDLLQLLNHTPLHSPDAASFNLRSLLRDPFLIPDSKNVLELLHEFRQMKVHMAIVLDEYGGTAGLITIEDILEEIVGEIQDEYEPVDDEPSIETLSEQCSKADARMHIDDLNDKLGTDLPEDEDYDTLGGFVFATLGHIPDVGESFEAHGVKFTVSEAERTKVISVTLEIQEPVAGTKLE